MAEPTPTPEPAQLLTAGEIMMISPSGVLAIVSSIADQDLSDAAWALTLADLLLWPDIRDEEGDLKRIGSIEFFEQASIRTRLDFRNRLRIRYGLSPLQDEIGRASSTAVHVAVPIGADW